ncbi:MAG: PTS sugar transporter subunit IIC/EAL domain-containing protein [Clostridia bacterium]|nr:PTS sugar transporter subunit IIC/EAL domain-containing protein [Clostridia bacterium]
MSKPKKFIRGLEGTTVVRSVRDGLINIIPILIIGAFALILNTFPVEGYQSFIQSFLGGFFPKLFNLVNKGTFGVLSLYMTFSISRSYMQIKSDPEAANFGAALSSVLSFFILAGVDLADFSVDSMGPKSMFLAIITGLGASALYLCFDRAFRKKRRKVFSSGADRVFNRMLTVLPPMALVALIAALINLAVIRFFGADSFRILLAHAFEKLFSYGEVGFLKGFFFVLFSSVLWFFGIHGSDTLEGVMEKYFTPLLAQNQAAVTAGAAPAGILTKQFFDCFVLMGGCGSTICLLIAILLFSRNRSKRGLGLTAAFPMIFNINELMVFGLPIIFNPIMLFPFLAVPLVCYSSAYLATAAGLVPVITNSVEWTTPVILGGLRATGSVAGALMQVFNIIVGVLIYMPFVRLLDRRSEEEARRTYDSFIDYYKKNESALNSERLIDLPGLNGELARELCSEIRHSADLGDVALAYQPQYGYDGACIGAEALLRYKHPAVGVLYPPLVIKLADEGGFLQQFEEAIIKKALSDREKVLARFGENVKLSVNVNGKTVVTERFLSFCRDLDKKVGIKGKNLCIEVTERATLSLDSETRKTFDELREMGFLLAIDDFSMGQTSINYLKEKTFDIIKLDGSLVSGLETHQNCREIVSSIVTLSSTLGLTVIAEYVQTDKEREMLHNIGCDCYQGYLYSPAVFID